MEKESIKKFKKAFKKYKIIGLPVGITPPGLIHIVWCNDDKTWLPGYIFVGISRGKLLSKYTFNEVESIEYEKPGLFKKGVFYLKLKDGSIPYSFEFKDKANIKEIKNFNEKLRICNEMLELDESNDTK